MNPIESIYKNKIVAVIRAEESKEAVEKAQHHASVPESGMHALHH